MCACIISYKGMGQGLQDRVVVSHIHKQDCRGGMVDGVHSNNLLCLHIPIQMACMLAFITYQELCIL